MDSGSINAGSIPARDARFEYRFIFNLCSFNMKNEYKGRANHGSALRTGFGGAESD